MFLCFTKMLHLMGTWLHQLRCDCVLQQECYKVMHSLLVHTDTREATMNYLTQVLLRNSKRAQIQASLFFVCMVVASLSLSYTPVCFLIFSHIVQSLVSHISVYGAKLYLCIFNV